MSLTPDQLAAIKARLELDGTHPDLPCTCSSCVLEDIKLLLDDRERLTRHNQRMSQALAQLSDEGNWSTSGIRPVWWVRAVDPIELAERALVEDG